MRSFVIVSVVLGVALGQVLPRDTPEVEAARNAFIAEYNRLAKLAAMAPDIHIYRRDPVLDPVTRVPRPINPPSFNAFSFSANLGDNQEFVPGPNVFPGASHMPRHQTGHIARHHVTTRPVVKQSARVPVPAAPRPTFAEVPVFQVADEPLTRWTGPFADEVPAGLSGHVLETPSVAAAKAAHFQAHADFWNQLRRSPAQR